MLEIVRELVSGFHDEGIRYCHWKSNQHLKEACNGDGDLDMLFDRRQRSTVVSVLARNNFKRLESNIDRQFPGIEDYIGMDSSTGRFVHLQVHYCLVTGQSLLKNYHLSVERTVLDNVVVDEETGVMVPAPEYELAIHVIRTCIKIGLSKVLRPGLRRAMQSEAAVESASLEKRCTGDAVDAFLAMFPQANAGEFVKARESIKSGSGAHTWLSARRPLIRLLSDFRRRTPLKTLVSWLVRRSYLALHQRILGRTPQRKLSSGGFGIAVIGSDGAGKSTAIAGLREWLGEYLDVHEFHMGKPPKGVLTFLIAYTFGAMRRLRIGVAAPQPTSADHKVWSNELAWLPALLLWSLARDRLRSYRRARRTIGSGSLVIFDRFPLEGLALMEGPQVPLVADPGVAVYRRLAESESGIYKRIRPPELLLALSVDPEIAATRQPADGREYVLRRASEVLRYIDETSEDVVVIDAGDPLESVRQAIRNAVWAAI